jgi:hypothetical protein
LKGSKNHNSAKPDKDLKFPQNLRLISLLSTTGTLFEKLISRTIQKHTEERNLINSSQFGFRADHRTTLQCMRLADHINLKFNNNMSTAAVFFDIEKAFYKTWKSSLFYKLSELAFSTSLIKLIASYLTKRKSKVLLEGEFFTPRIIAAGWLMFRPDTCIFATEKHEHRVLCKLQRCLTAVNSWCER